MAQSFVEVRYDSKEGLTLCLRLIPGPSIQHLSSSIRELLLALRNFVDRVIARVAESCDGKARCRRRVNIEA